jgi:hypothetical protein
VSGLPMPFDAGLAKKGRFHERNQYFLRSPYRALHDPAAPLDAQPETTDLRISIAKDVPGLRIDHVSIKGKLLGVWQALFTGRVLDFKEMNRHFVKFRNLYVKDNLRYENDQIRCES